MTFQTKKESVEVLTLLTLRALALARLISGVSGIMWIDVLSLSQTSLYFGYGKNHNNKITLQFVILLVRTTFNFPDPKFFHIKEKTSTGSSHKLLKLNMKLVLISFLFKIYK